MTELECIFFEKYFGKSDIELSSCNVLSLDVIIWGKMENKITLE